MRILLISSTFPPRKFGGVTRSSYILAKSLVERGHDVTVYTTDVNDRHSRVPNVKGVKSLDGIAVQYFRNISNWLASLRLYSPVGMVAAIRNESSKFDIIHLNEYRSLQSIAVHRYARRHGIPYILQARGSLITFFYKGWFKRIFDAIWGYRILKDAAKVVALNQAEAEQYKGMGVSPDRVEVVPNGIELDEFASLPSRGEFRKHWGVDDKQKVVLFLSRINKIKGPDLLTKAFAELSKDVDNVKLVFVGPDDGYLPYLKKLVGELKISDKVLFTGTLYGKGKLEAYVDADIYVLSSSYEIFGNTVLEALACGTPVILTDRCSIADVINGRAGLVVPYDAGQLKKALLHILGDDKLRREFGERGKLLVRENFDWKKITERIEGIYKQCIDR